MNINKRKPFTPGEVLQEEFMNHYQLTQQELAKKLDVPRRRVNEIINGKRAITPDTALRLSKLFNMSPEFWLMLQLKIDLWNALHNQKMLNKVAKIESLKDQVTR